MGLAIDWFNNIISITAPDTSVSLQVLHDFIEDQMATPIGAQHADIIQPEGKIEDPVNPGVFSQIIIILNSPWQIQFWQGSGFTRLFGAKLVGGLNDEPIKATGAAGDITVLESPVDGLTITASGITPTQQQIRDAMLLTPGGSGSANSVDEKLDNTPAATMAALKLETFDNETFETIVERLKSWGYGRFVETSEGVFDYYDNAGTTVLFTLTHSGDPLITRTRS